MKLSFHIASSLIGAASLFCQPQMAAAQVPVGTQFTYQGVLKNSGVPLNGTVDLRFTLWDAAVGGNQIGAAVPVNAVVIADGLVTANLNFGPGAFAGSQRFLQIEVDSTPGGGAGPFVTLTPRQQLNSVPYALFSLGGSGQWTPSGSNLNYTSGNVSIGTSTSSAKVTIYPNSGGGGVQTGLLVRNLNNADQYTVARFEADSPSAIAISAIVPSVNGATGRAIAGTNTSTTGWAGYFTGRVHVSSDVGIGTTDPQYRVHVEGGTVYSQTSQIPIRGRKTGTGTFPGVQGETDSTSSNASGVRGYVNALTPGTSSAGVLGRNFATNNVGVGVMGTHDSGGYGVMGVASGAGGYGGVFGDLSGAGQGILALKQTHLLDRTGIGTNAPNSMLHVNGATGTNPLRVQNAGLTKLLVHDNGFVMIGSANTPQDTLHVAGTTRTNVLRIMGGSDLSENFDVAELDQALPQPGMVVCIDPANPGKLIPSTRAYDRTVAGVISGANGINSGMIMGQEGSEADGAFPVALTGRVYVLVDAADGAIEPGDLLTTSDTPGHAMAARDASRSHGSIIGKAMTALPHGEKGMVLVLVSLQ